MSEYINVPDFDRGNTPKERLIHLENYFRGHSKHEPRFLPELEAAEKVNALLQNEFTSDEEIIQIVKIYNTANKLERYNGCGWYDFNYAIRKLAQENDCETILLEDKSLLLSSCRSKSIPFNYFKINITSIKDSETSLDINSIIKIVLLYCWWNLKESNIDDDKLFLLSNNCTEMKIYKKEAVILEGKINSSYLNNLEELLSNYFIYEVESKRIEFNN
jgi:hypothetical protein